MSSKEKARLYHELGTLLASGFHMDRAIDLLLGQKPSASRRRWLEGLRRGLGDKLGVADALTKHCSEDTSEMELGLIGAGERGGRLEESCQHLAGYFELREKSTAKALGALVYPLMLANLGALMPDLSAAMRGNGLGAAFASAPWRLLALWVIIGLTAAVVLGLLKLARTSMPVDRALAALPLVGSVRSHWALARFCEVMRTSLLAALRISDSLRMAGAASQGAVMQHGAARAATRVEQGETLSAAVRAGGGFPPTFENALEMAEQSGTLDVEMQRWTKLEMETAARAQDRLAEWLPRLVYFLVMLYIAWKIVSGFSGVYGKGGVYDSILNG